MRVLTVPRAKAPPPAVAPEAALESDEKRRKQEHVDLFGDLATLEKALGGGASGASAQDRRLGLHAPKASDEASRAGPAPPADDLFASVVADVPWYSAPHDQGRGAREAQKQKLERAEQHAQRKRRADAHTKDREDPLFAMSVILEAKRQLQGALRFLCAPRGSIRADINERHGGALDAAYVEQQQRSRAADRRPPRRPPLPVAGPVIADDIRAKAAKHAKVPVRAWCGCFC